MTHGAPTLDDVPCGVVTTAESGLVLYCNTRLCDWLGYRADELVGVKRFAELLSVGARIFHQTHWVPLLKLRGSVAEVQLELRHKDGTAFPALLNAVARARDGVVHHDIAIFHTQDRKKYERALLDARQQAEQLLDNERAAQGEIARLLGEREQEAQQRAIVAEQLIGIVSHDLRSPLNAILLGATLLEDTASEVDRRTVARISASANRATALIGDLLDFTQARLGGGLSVRLADVDLHDVVADCIDELRLAWPGRGIEHTAIGAGSGRVDAVRVGQLMTNLVGNAMTYGDTALPVVVRTAVDAATQTIQVENRGAPIDPTLLPHIFEPLRRGEQGGSFKSIGLGLYIVREIARAHGGDVSVASSIEGGTCFTVTLRR